MQLTSIVLLRTAEIVYAGPKIHIALAYARHVILRVNLTAERTVVDNVAPKCRISVHCSAKVEHENSHEHGLVVHQTNDNQRYQECLQKKRYY